MSFGRYDTYRDSGLEWLGELPAHWRLEPIKRLCDVRPSNVDKKSQDDEIQVRLCNYTDVYYQDRITASLDFMTATATPEQIVRFELQAGDVIITKDSETADHIAIPAYVPEALPGVVCGYHLALLRPRDADGAFIKRYFDSRFAKDLVAVRANGLTRVGLGQYALDNLPLPTPRSMNKAPMGAGKAKFFKGVGFSENNVEEFIAAVRAHAAQNKIAALVPHSYGVKTIIDCFMPTPSGKSYCIRSVWNDHQDGSPPKLITAHPL